MVDYANFNYTDLQYRKKNNYIPVQTSNHLVIKKFYMTIIKAYIYKHLDRKEEAQVKYVAVPYKADRYKALKAVENVCNKEEIGTVCIAIDNIKHKEVKLEIPFSKAVAGGYCKNV